MYFFTSDEHYFHKNIIKYCDRPFDDVQQMKEKKINNHNQVVGVNDTTIHCGDFSFGSKELTYKKVISRLNGKHVFLKGDHDKWLGKSGSYMWLKRIQGQPIICAHYMMRTWWLSHWNSWNLFGHSHGGMNDLTVGKQMDVGVDSNNFYPVSFDDIKEIMDKKPDNFNFIKKSDRNH